MAAGAGGTFLASLARMNKKTIDALLTAMLQTSDGVSDLLFICGRPPLVEIHGQLTEFPIDTPTGVLDETLIERIAQHIQKYLGGSTCRRRVERSNA